MWGENGRKEKAKGIREEDVRDHHLHILVLLNQADSNLYAPTHG